jgi:hypothetical protein
MEYTLEEHSDSGGAIFLGEPFADLMVAKVIAARRAARTGRLVVVRDRTNGREVARYEPSGLGESVARLRAAASFDSEQRKKSSA